MGWFSRAVRSVGRTVTHPRKTVNKIGKGVGKAVKAVHKAVDKVDGGLLDVAGGIISKGLSVTNKIKNTVESVVRKLPYGETALLVAKLTVPQIAAMEVMLANGQQLNDFVSNGSLDVKSLMTNAIKNKVPGYQKLVAANDKLNQARAVANSVSAGDIGGISRGLVRGLGEDVVGRISRNPAYLKNAARFIDHADNIKNLAQSDEVARLNRTVTDVKALRNAVFRGKPIAAPASGIKLGFLPNRQTGGGIRFKSSGGNLAKAVNKSAQAAAQVAARDVVDQTRDRFRALVRGGRGSR